MDTAQSLRYRAERNGNERSGELARFDIMDTACRPSRKIAECIGGRNADIVTAALNEYTAVKFPAPTSVISPMGPFFK